MLTMDDLRTKTNKELIRQNSNRLEQTELDLDETKS